MGDWLGPLAILVVCGSVAFLVMYVIHITKPPPGGSRDEERRAR
jgi:hypothetical protein